MRSTLGGFTEVARLQAVAIARFRFERGFCRHFHLRLHMNLAMGRMYDEKQPVLALALWLELERWLAAELPRRLTVCPNKPRPQEGRYNKVRYM